MKNFIVLGTVAASLIACSNASDFKGKANARSLAAEKSPDNGDAQATLPPADPTFNFSLLVNKGGAVSPAQMAGAIPGVQDALKAPLSDNELADWKVKIHVQDAVADSATQVSPQFVDLSSNSGLTTVVADFNNSKNQKTGQATAIVYVDGEAPKAKIIHLSDSVDGKTTQIAWSATDNYKLDESKLLIIGCTDFVQSLMPRNRADLDNLPANCVSVYAGADLASKPSTLDLGALKIAGLDVASKDAKFAIYAEDMVGLSSFVWMTADENGLLSLTATPNAVQYTKVKAQKINLKLLHVHGSDAVQVEQAVNAKLWPDFETKVTASMGAMIAPADFAPSFNVNLGPADGTYVYGIQVDERATGLASNNQTVRFILDTTPPKVDGIQIVIDKIVPSPSSKVSVVWNVTDASPITGQYLEVKGLSDTAWTKIGTVSGTAKSFSFDWGNRKPESFEIRISATDAAGNVGTGSNKWTKQIFNAAILTTSVQCYFCHVRVDGDVGGIDFPATIHPDSGHSFQINGNFYATNTIPALLKSSVIGAGHGYSENYNNSGFKIFPKNNKFPVLTAADLKPHMNGTLTAGSTTLGAVNKGNFILDGSSTPIALRGEIFVDGDIVIKGSYRGVGTIYANNIYIVGDLKATKSPFPYNADSDVAMQQAQDSVVRGDDGLYLGALNQIVVGSYYNNLTLDDNVTKLVTTTPESWLSETNYEALGTRVSIIYNADGTNSGVTKDGNGHPFSDRIHAAEVNRVDAYLYSQDIVTWRSMNSYLLNGGFMSPRGGLVASLPHSLYGNDARIAQYGINKNNGVSQAQSAIRYDYRLRIGGGGFETLKTYFDQQ